MKQYKAVLIDWDDTIGDFIGAAKLALQEMYDKYHLSDYFASHEEFVSLYKPHNIELWDKYGKDLVTKAFLRVDRFLWPLLHGSKVGERQEARGERLMSSRKRLSELREYLLNNQKSNPNEEIYIEITQPNPYPLADEPCPLELQQYEIDARRAEQRYRPQPGAYG